MVLKDTPYVFEISSSGLPALTSPNISERLEGLRPMWGSIMVYFTIGGLFVYLRI